MRDIPVHNSNWSGAKNESFNWNNPNNTDSVITQDGGNPWPFTLASPVTINAGTSLPCSLVGASGTYGYICDANPKTVIIT